MRLVLMGMPGVGKGTQAVRLMDVLGAPHVSTGDLLRDAARNGSTLGRKVRVHLQDGSLVPEDLMGQLIVERLGRGDAREGFILDGYPRTPDQVAVLDRVLGKLGVELDSVFLLTVAEKDSLGRLTGRRVCPACDEVFHVNHRPPRSAGVCDACGQALVQRQDDQEDAILERLEIFREQTLPIIRTYAERGILHEVDGSGAPEEVFSRLRAGLEK